MQMKFLVVGCGSIGKRHLRNLRALGYDDILVLRSRRKDVDVIEREFGAVSFFDLDQALAEKPDIVIIANPTHLHVPVALAAARSGAHLFIEKPLSLSLDGVAELLALIKQNSLQAMVAYPLRFHPGLRKMRSLLQEGAIGKPLYVHAEVGSYLPDWRPGSDYRQLYSAHADQGGGVILDLSHELDYLFWLFGAPRRLSAHAQRTGALEIHAEDSADILMETADGLNIALHLDYLQRPPVRQCKVVGAEGTLVWDYMSGEVRAYQAASDEWVQFNFDGERNEMYIAELRHFIAAVENDSKLLIPLEQGVRVLQICLTAKKSAQAGRRVDVHYDL